MKGSSLNTHLGSITIDNEVLAQYAGTVAVECFGIVGMAGINVKDGLVRLLKKDSLTRGIEVSIVNNKLVLDFHVIVAYGVSISAVSDNLISNVKYKVSRQFRKKWVQIAPKNALSWGSGRHAATRCCGVTKNEWDFFCFSLPGGRCPREFPVL